MQKKCIIMLGQISGQISVRDNCPEPCPDLLPQGFAAVGTNLRTPTSNEEWGGLDPPPPISSRGLCIYGSKINYSRGSA